MAFGFWNVHGWNTNFLSDNYQVRFKSIVAKDLDIIGIAETHLVGDIGMDIPGYHWFGQNRKTLHHRAKTGSGGVGFLIKTSVLDNFDVSELDTSCEGILWL